MACRPARSLVSLHFSSCLCARAAQRQTLRRSRAVPRGRRWKLTVYIRKRLPSKKIFPAAVFTRQRRPSVRDWSISLAGYATKELQMTDGPMNWISFNGRSHGEYWLLKSDHFHVDLRPISEVFTGGVAAKLSSAGRVDLQPELSLEELVRRTKPAVVYLKGLGGSGTGFFVTLRRTHTSRGAKNLF
jgi:hypothetical protein